MRLHWREWGSVRVGVGFNGLFFRCSDLPSIIRFFEAKVAADPSRSRHFAIDWAIDRWLIDAPPPASSDASGAVVRQPFVFRWNLLRHAAADAGNIWDRMESAERDTTTPKCLEVLNWSSEQSGHFNLRDCPHAMFSPCNAKSAVVPAAAKQTAQTAAIAAAAAAAAASGVGAVSTSVTALGSQLRFAGFNTPQAMAPLEQSTAEWLFRSMGSALVRGELGQSCDDVCHRQSPARQCDRALFHAVNRCDLLRALEPNCVCSYAYGRELPMWHRNAEGTTFCYVQIFPDRRFDCAARWNEAKRLCPCK
jgi:hypothetical protein